MPSLLDSALGWMQDPRRTQQLQGTGRAIQQGLLNIQQSDKRFQDLFDKSFGDPKQPFKVTDKKALSELTQMTQSGLLGFASVGMLAPKKFVGKALEGLPSKVDVGGRIEEFGTDQRLVDIAKDITEKKGLVYSPQLKYAEVDPDRAKRLADAYDKMENNPSNKAVKKSYDAMIEETLEQYETLRKRGYKFSFMPESGDIYGNPRNAINDIVQNQRLSVFPTEQGFGTLSEASQANPLLMRIGEKWDGKEVTANDVFRAVHDVFGHGKHGVGFRAGGEENAFQAHARMYSPEALPAVTSETRGQNSWVNYGPFGELNRKASPLETIYADQKTGILPNWTWVEGLLK